MTFSRYGFGMALKRSQKRPGVGLDLRPVRDPETGAVLFWRLASGSTRAGRLTERQHREPKESRQQYRLRLFVDVDDAYDAVRIVLRFLDLAQRLGYTSIAPK
ncbi:hypothetical protein, partial [Kitasatospora herbaricolor]|uniref:hypothetical protein n=1 Tax=Kitasatospora herbaricolor TaxID=68217 RepID=UPI0036DD1499